jgi:aconitate hydratase
MTHEHDVFHTKKTIEAPGGEASYYSLLELAAAFPNVARLPYSIRTLLEALLRNCDGLRVTREDIEALANWNPAAPEARELPFIPSRVILQDFTGVPCIVDLAAMREAVAAAGGDPTRVNPLVPVDLVIDHSVQVDAFGTKEALSQNLEREFSRNRERYEFLKWGQKAFKNLRVIPPGVGIVHQVNLEYLASVVHVRDGVAYPDTLVGTDSHTTMINGLGVVGWGVGGIEAEAAMLGQPVYLLTPKVVGFELTGALPEGATATDLVLTITQKLRKHGVVDKFVEFHGPGARNLSLADRATIANMAPEYGATIGYFPVDEETVAYLRGTGRNPLHADFVERYAKAQGIFAGADAPTPVYSESLSLDLTTVGPSLAGPKRPQDRVALKDVAASFKDAFPEATKSHGALKDGDVTIAAITSCTNTSNPSVMLAAGLLARKAVERGLSVPAHVKTSLAPGSKVVTRYLEAAGLIEPLEKLKFNVVGYGCTTCIGNSGPLPEEIGRAVKDGALTVASLLSGNRNFEGRVHAQVKANYLASPPLVVAYALAGRIGIDFEKEAIGADQQGNPVFLKDLWPSAEEVRMELQKALKPELYRQEYGQAEAGPEAWGRIRVPEGQTFDWEAASTYIRKAPFVESAETDAADAIREARVLAMVGDSVTTDHISPAGSISADGAAAKYLEANGVAWKDFNSYGARRGNHEVMVRGTFANVRLKNALAGGAEGGVTSHLPTGEIVTIHEASDRYAEAGTPLIVMAGKDYGMGSSRDWAAKGPKLLGIRAALFESVERIHRSNLIGMGILPLQYEAGETAATLGLTGHETFAIEGLSDLAPGKRIRVTAKKEDGAEMAFTAVCRLDTPIEVEYYRAGGILPYVLKQLVGSEKVSAA